MFGKKLRIRMAERGITIRELADTLNVSEFTLRSWLYEKRKPVIDRWGLLESMFGDDLFDDEIATTSLPPHIPRASLREEPQDIDEPVLAEKVDPLYIEGPPLAGAPAKPEPEPELEIGPAHYGETL